MDPHHPRRALLLAVLFLATAPPVPADEGRLAPSYAEHGPLACVDGAVLSEYEGRPYDASLVQGQGTPEDPHVLQGVQISLSEHPDYPAGILLIRCPHFQLVDSRTYGSLGRDPWCRGEGRVRASEVAPYGVLAIDSTGVRIEGTVLEYGRLAGLYQSGGEVRVSRSDITVNFGAGVRATRDAWLNLSENYIAYNGWFMPEDPPVRDGRILPTWAAGIYLDEGAYVEAYNNTIYRNENAVNIDKSLDISTSAVFNYNTISASDWAEVVVVGYGEENRMGWCTDDGAPSWWGTATRPPEPEPESTSTPTHARSQPTPPLPELPLYEEIPDSEADPVNVVNVRLNFWGQFNGPSPVDMQGKADYRFWLPAESPRVALAGVARTLGHGRDYDTLSRTLEAVEKAVEVLLP